MTLNISTIGGNPRVAAAVVVDLDRVLDGFTDNARETAEREARTEALAALRRSLGLRPDQPLPWERLVMRVLHTDADVVYEASVRVHQ